jgi:hypothetical protein
MSSATSKLRGKGRSIFISYAVDPRPLREIRPSKAGRLLNPHWPNSVFLGILERESINPKYINNKIANILKDIIYEQLVWSVNESRGYLGARIAYKHQSSLYQMQMSLGQAEREQEWLILVLYKQLHFAIFFSYENRSRFSSMVP